MAGVPARSRTCTPAYVVAVTPVAVSPCTPAYKPSVSSCVHRRLRARGPVSPQACTDAYTTPVPWNALVSVFFRSPVDELRRPSDTPFPKGLRWAGRLPAGRGEVRACVRVHSQVCRHHPPPKRGFRLGGPGLPRGQRKCGLVFVYAARHAGTTSPKRGWRGPRAAAGGSCGPVFVYAVRHAGRTLFVLRGTRAGERRKPRGPPARLGYLGGLPDPRARRPAAVVRSARWPTGTWRPPIAGPAAAARTGAGVCMSTISRCLFEVAVVVPSCDVPAGEVAPLVVEEGHPDAVGENGHRLN